MTLLIAQWTGTFPRNTDSEPIWDTEIVDGGNWLNPATGEIQLPIGSYHVTFSGRATANLAAVTSRVYAALAVQDLVGGAVVVSRHRTNREAGQLQPAFNIGGDFKLTQAMDLHTQFRYDNTADVGWGFEVNVHTI